MNLLLIGSGGREHAIAWKLAQNSKVETIYCAPGNGGTSRENKCKNVDITKIDELVEFAKRNKIDLTVVGPEEPLTKGIVNIFKENGLRIFGPSKEGAVLEGSKAFSKEFMKKYGVKTAEYEVFSDESMALEYIKDKEFPLVVKADGLAAGKGVIICNTLEEGKSAIEELMNSENFKESGKTIVIEEFLEGVEASILSITDGETIIPFISAKDHKQILDDNKGPNTGGMGVVCPNPYVNDEIMNIFEENIMNPTLRGIKEEKMDFVGIIFFGLMITKKGVYLLEYNVRMGDPETQGVLSLMKSDLLTLIEKALEKDLKNAEVQWENKSACVVIGASSGYPGSYEKNKEISIGDIGESKVFMAGVKDQGNKLLTNGGRVLAVVSKAETLDLARKMCYKNIQNVRFENIYYRRDIGIAK